MEKNIDKIREAVEWYRRIIPTPQCEVLVKLAEAVLEKMPREKWLDASGTCESFNAFAEGWNAYRDEFLKALGIEGEK